MEPTKPPQFNEKPVWDPAEGEEIHHVQTRPESPGGGRRKRSEAAATTSTRSSGDSNATEVGSRGRRIRPSVASSGALMPTLDEKSTARKGSLSPVPSVHSARSIRLSSEELVVSSKDVSFPIVVTASSADLPYGTGLDSLQQGGTAQHRERSCPKEGGRQIRCAEQAPPRGPQPSDQVCRF